MGQTFLRKEVGHVFTAQVEGLLRLCEGRRAGLKLFLPVLFNFLVKYFVSNFKFLIRTAEAPKEHFGCHLLSLNAQGIEENKLQ